MKVVVVFLAVFFIGAHSIVLEPEQKEKLREIRNACIVQSGLNPYEIGIAKRAFGPIKKLVNASKCIVDRLVVLKEEDEVVGAIIDQTKLHISNLPAPVNNIVSNCENLLGKQTCGEVFQLIATIAENVQRNNSPLLREA